MIATIDRFLQSWRFHRRITRMIPRTTPSFLVCATSSLPNLWHLDGAKQLDNMSMDSSTIHRAWFVQQSHLFHHGYEIKRMDKWFRARLREEVAAYIVKHNREFGRNFLSMPILTKFMFLFVLKGCVVEVQLARHLDMLLKIRAQELLFCFDSHTI